MTMYSQLLCVAAAILAVEHNYDVLTGGVTHEAYLPAHQASSLQGAWLPPENGYCQRPQGSRPPSCQGPQGSVRLIRRSEIERPQWAKRETVRGEHRPAPFLFVAHF